MTMDGEYTATIDRIVDGETAVVLLEDNGEVIEQFDMPVKRLPSECDVGSVVTVVVGDDKIVKITSQPDETATRRERLREQFDRLSKRLGDDEE